MKRRGPSSAARATGCRRPRGSSARGTPSATRSTTACSPAPPTERAPAAGFELIAPAAAADGFAFYARLPFRVRRAIRKFRPEAIVAEDPRTATLVMLGRPPCGLTAREGDLRGARRLAALDAALRRRWAAAAVAARGRARPLRRAPFRRRASACSTRRRSCRQSAASCPTPCFPRTRTSPSSPSARRGCRLRRPRRSSSAWLERYKNIDGLVAAWRRVADRVPEALLVVVGKGPLRGEVEELAAELLGRVELIEELLGRRVRGTRRCNAARPALSPWALGRVVIEAFARGRGVVASRAGGVLDLVDDGVQGLLVDPEDTVGHGALSTVLSQREVAERLGAAAHALRRSGTRPRTSSPSARRSS